MKKLIAIILVLGGIHKWNPELLTNFSPSFLINGSSNNYAISEDEPLGELDSIDSKLQDLGFEVEDGASGYVYQHPKDAQEYPQFPSSIVVSTKARNLVSGIKASFVSTQHGYSPARKTYAERFLSDYWRSVAGKVPDFDTQKRGTNNRDFSATFQEDGLRGKWEYSEDAPFENVKIDWLK